MNSSLQEAVLDYFFKKRWLNGYKFVNQYKLLLKLFVARATMFTEAYKVNIKLQYRILWYHKQKYIKSCRFQLQMFKLYHHFTAIIYWTKHLVIKFYNNRCFQGKVIKQLLTITSLRSPISLVFLSFMVNLNPWYIYHKEKMVQYKKYLWYL